MGVRFDHDNLNLPLRGDVLEVLQAALVGADPHRAVRRVLDVDGTELHVVNRTENLEELGHIYVVGAGKAAARMAEAVEEVLGDRVSHGVVAVKDRYTGTASSIAIGEAAHPVPDERSLKAARAMAHVAVEAGREDLVLCLVSGGGSSLLAMPAGELALEDIRETTASLLASGLGIGAINTVRKHLSRIKGGRLAERIAPARMATLAISDVVGDALDAIASGPTVPDPTTYRDATEVFERADLADRVPGAVVEHLRAGAEGRYPETPGPGHRAFRGASAVIAASRADALEAGRKAAEGAEYETRVMTSELEGEAREVGRTIAEEAVRVSEGGASVAPPACLLYAGETTVTVRGEGKGGRCQELALAAAIALDEISEGFDRSIAIAAFATDGTDGPTRAAGAIVGPGTARRARDAGYEPRFQLRKNNSFQVLYSSGDLLVTGPTRNNVSDLICVLVD